MTYHMFMSYVKSGVRIAACVLLFPHHPMFSTLFGLAEMVGIMEELKP